MGTIFLRGLAVLVPLLLTGYLCVWSVLAIEQAVQKIALFFVEPESYTTGVGVPLALGVVFAVGLLMSSRISQRLYTWLENLLTSIPLIGTVYGGFKDFFDYFSLASEGASSQVVVVTLPQSDQKVLGLVTSETPEDMLDGVAQGLIAVYIPMSYQLGGFTLLLTEDEIQRVNVPMEKAFRFILTAGVKRKEVNAATAEAGE